MACSIDLFPHRDTSGGPVSSIVASINMLSVGMVRMRFCLTGALDRVRWPEPREPERRDDLWQHTCLELFLRRPGDAAYWELNLSPGGRWAAYRFADYRRGMESLPLAQGPAIAFRRTGEQATLDATVELTERLGVMDANPTAVIEDLDGRKYYWATWHSADGPPDFHAPECFARRVTAA